LKHNTLDTILLVMEHFFSVAAYLSLSTLQKQILLAVDPI